MLRTIGLNIILNFTFMLRTTETGKKSCRASSVFIFSSSNSLTFKKRTRPSKTFLYKNQPFPSPPWQILEWSSVHSLQRSKKQPWWGWRGQRQMLDSLHQNHLDSSTHWVSLIVGNGLSINWWSKPDEGQDGNANSLLIISCIKFILSNIPASLRKIYLHIFRNDSLTRCHLSIPRGRFSTAACTCWLSQSTSALTGCLWSPSRCPTHCSGSPGGHYDYCKPGMHTYLIVCLASTSYICFKVLQVKTLSDCL